MSESKKGKIVTMENELDVAEAKFKKEEAEILSILKEKFDITKKQIDTAAKVEQELSQPETGVNTIVGGMEFYKEKGLTESQILFLAVNANSRSNMHFATTMKYQEELKRLSQIMELMAQAAEKETSKED